MGCPVSTDWRRGGGGKGVGRDEGGRKGQRGTKLREEEGKGDDEEGGERKRSEGTLELRQGAKLGKEYKRGGKVRWEH